MRIKLDSVNRQKEISVEAGRMNKELSKNNIHDASLYVKIFE